MKTYYFLIEVCAADKAAAEKLRETVINAVEDHAEKKVGGWTDDSAFGIAKLVSIP